MQNFRFYMQMDYNSDMEVIMKKLLICISMFLVFFSLQACTEKEEIIEITLKQNNPVIDGQLKALASAYELETGIRINIVSCGPPNCSYDESLKSDQTAGKFPEIFVLTSKESYSLWSDTMMDLSDESWVNETSLAFAVDDQVFGLPLSVEGWGMAYNADMLKAADIDPMTLNNMAAYLSAFKKLDGMKDALGIDAVVSMSAATPLNWLTGRYNFNSFLSEGLAFGDLSLTSELRKGNMNAERLNEYADWVEQLFTYSEPTILISGNYESQVNAFLNQKTVFLNQGYWADGILKDATFDMAFAPYGSTKTPSDGIFVNVTSWYAVNKNSLNAQLAKDFLNFLVSSETGQDFLVNKIKLIPAFRNFEIEPKEPLSNSVYQWIKQDKFYSANFSEFPLEFLDNSLGPIYNQLARDMITVQQFKFLITQAVKNQAK